MPAHPRISSEHFTSSSSPINSKSQARGEDLTIAGCSDSAVPCQDWAEPVSISQGIGNRRPPSSDPMGIKRVRRSSEVCNGNLSEEEGMSAIFSNPSDTEVSGISIEGEIESSERVRTSASSSMESPIGSK